MFFVVVLCYYFVVIDVIVWIVVAQGWISYMYVNVCEYICSRMIREYWVCFGVYECVLRYLMCLLYLHHVVDIMDFLFMLSAYAGCPELNRFSPSILFPSTNIEGHIVGVVNCTCILLMFWTIMNFFLKMFHALISNVSSFILISNWYICNDLRYTRSIYS